MLSNLNVVEWEWVLVSSIKAVRAKMILVFIQYASNPQQSTQSLSSSSCPHISGIQTRPATSPLCLFSLSLPQSSTVAAASASRTLLLDWFSPPTTSSLQEELGGGSWCFMDVLLWVLIMCREEKGKMGRMEKGFYFWVGEVKVVLVLSHVTTKWCLFCMATHTCTCLFGDFHHPIVWFISSFPHP